MTKSAQPPISVVRRAYERLGANVVLGVSWLFQRTPVALSKWVARALGAVWYAADARHRRVAEDNLRQAFGDALSDDECGRIVRAVFANVSANIVEFLTMPKWSYEDLLTFIDLEEVDTIDSALAEGNGVILLTAHFGNWELMAGGGARRGLPLSAVARPLNQVAINDAVTEIRESTGLRIIQRRTGALAALRTLRKGHALGILADQNTRRDGVFVEFFGRPAATTPAPAYLAIKTGAAVLPCYLIRVGPRRFRMRVEPRIPPVLTGNLEQDVLLTTQRFTAELERMIRLHPENWFWIHRRWKTQPPADWTPPRVPEQETVSAG